MLREPAARSNRIRLLAALLAAVTLAGCASSPAASDDDLAAGEPPRGRGEYEAMAAAAEHVSVWARSIAGGVDGTSGVAGTVSSQAVSLRADLDHLWREHVATIALTAQAEVAGRDEVALAGMAALRRIEDDLLNRIAVLYDERAAARIRPLWDDQVLAWRRVASAIATDDDGERRLALDELDAFATDLADEVVGLTNGEADGPRLADDLRLFVEKTSDVIDAVVAEDASWLAELASASHHAGTVAERLAVPIATDLVLDGDVTAAAAVLRTELDAQMTDAVTLVVAASRAALTAGEGEPAAALDAVDDPLAETTTALEDALRPHLPAGDVRDVGDLWRRHDELLVQLAAVRAGVDDRATAEELRDQLAAWAADLGTTLEEVTEGRLDARKVEADAEEHVATLDAVLRRQSEVLGG